jgi:hypothetical protein
VYLFIYLFIVMYERPEQGTDVPEHVGVEEDHILNAFVTCA